MPYLNSRNNVLGIIHVAVFTVFVLFSSITKFVSVVILFISPQDQDNVQLYLGLTPVGIAIIREGKKVSGFNW